MAARAFANGSAVEEDDAISDARMMGASAAQLDEIRSQLALNQDVYDGLWPEHVPAFEALLAAYAQFRTTIIFHKNRYVRLLNEFDLTAAAAAWGIHQIIVTPLMLGQIATLARATADAWNEEALQ